MIKIGLDIQVFGNNEGIETELHFVQVQV